ncbi:hypothetical protein GCM10009101_12030 [Brevundimonas lenta]
MLIGLAPMLPMALFLRKAGYSPFWALLWILPIINVIAFVLFAFLASRGPRAPSGSPSVDA